MTAHNPIAVPPRGPYGEIAPGGAIQLPVVFPMKAVPFLFLSLLLLLAPRAGADEIQLSGQRSLETDLYEARLISELRGYAILSGRSCVNCDENTSIYIQKISANGDEDSGAESGIDRYTYPGQYADYESKRVVEKTRMFYGRCYENEPALLWLSESLTESGWVKSEYLIVFREGHLEHRYNEGRQPSIFYIENGDCRELPGIIAETEP
ncbi:hypothetical protein [Microbulbifer sp.]|uniref:hypothetical protein n=1 Tax=Microbulbifer sp. TaxID=1908541 RepID=UPI003F2E397E